jgi:hypothetical protein
MDNNYSSNNSGISDYFFSALYNTFVSTKGRLITLSIVLILHFFPINYLIDYNTSYNTFKQQYDNIYLFYFLVSGIIKCILALYLIIISPKMNSGISEILKYAFLAFFTFLFFVLTSISEDSYDNESVLFNKSFIENKVSIFGKVVFSSYGTTKYVHKFYSLPQAKPLSKDTDWLIIIVQIDKSEYLNYPGLKNFTHNYNQLRLEKDGNLFYSNKIKHIAYDIPDCIKFEFRSWDKPPLAHYPGLPQIDSFVKLYFDPIENGISLLTSKNPDKLVPGSYNYNHDYHQQRSIRMNSSNFNSIEISVFK